MKKNKYIIVHSNHWAIGNSIYQALETFYKLHGTFQGEFEVFECKPVKGKKQVDPYINNFGEIVSQGYKIHKI